MTDVGQTAVIWDPTDFLECLGVVPVEDEDRVSHSYTVTNHGMRLEMTLYQYDGDVQMTLWRDGVEAPVVSLNLVDCDAARRMRDQRGFYLEFAAARLFDGRYDGDAAIPHGVRLRVDPSIGIEFFRSNA